MIISITDMKTKVKLNLRCSCRVCLEQSENMLSIFTKDDSQILADKIADCGGINIELNNYNYPDKICPKCMAFLNISYKFRTTCKNTDNLLRSLLTKSSGNSSTELAGSSSSSSNSTHKQTTRSAKTMTLVKKIQQMNDYEEIVYQIEAENDEEHDRRITKVDFEIEDENLIKIEQMEDDVSDGGGREEKGYEICEDSTDLFYMDEEQQHEESEVDKEKRTKPSKVQENENEKRVYNKRERKHEKSRRIKLSIRNLDNDDDDDDDDDNDSDYNPSNNDDNDDDDDDVDADDDDNVDVLDDDDSREKVVLKKRRKKRTSHKITSKKKSRKISSIDKFLSDNIKCKIESSKCEYICEICGNKYKKKVLLDSHMRWHNEEKAYKCEVCGRAFTINFQLTRHMRVHTGDKPYSCNTCGRKFSDYSTCKKHQRTHTDERPFKCEICGKAFNYSHVLKVHMAVHTGEKPYACDQCDKKFSQPHHLKAHLATLLHQSNNTVEKNDSNSGDNMNKQLQEEFTYVEQLEEYNIQDNCEVVAITLEEDDS